MTVATMLNSKGSDIISISPSQTIGDAVNILGSKGIGAIVVLDDSGTLAGILSERDIVRGLAAHGAAVMDHLVESLMTAKVQTCSVNDTSDMLMKRMTEGRFRHMPATDDAGKLVGVISIGDVVKSRISELEHETEAMRDYISGYA